MEHIFDLKELYKEYCNAFPFDLNQKSETAEWTDRVKCFWVNQAISSPNNRVQSRISTGQVHANHVNHEKKYFDLQWISDHIVLLALEHEWEEIWDDNKGHDGQKHDLMKLLEIEAPYKIFSFQINRKTNSLQNRVNEILGLISNRKVSWREEWLLISHQDDKHKNPTCTTINSCYINRDGHMEELPQIIRAIPV